MGKPSGWHCAIWGLTGAAALFSALAHAATVSVAKGEPGCDDAAGKPFCSLRAAVAAAQPGDRVSVSTGHYLGGIHIEKDLQIVADALDGVVVDGEKKHPVFVVSPGVSVELQHLHIKGGWAEEGGGVLNRGRLRLDHCEVSDNIAEFRGGGIYNGGSLSGELVIENSRIYNNRSVADDPYNVKYGGGGIYNNAPLHVVNSEIVANYAHDNGGGMYTVFSGRKIPSEAELMAERFGLQIAFGPKKTLARFVDDGAVRIEKSVIADNEATAGGGINLQGVLVMDQSVVEGNRAMRAKRSAGGGIFAHFNTRMTLVNSTISRNEASYRGGGIRFYSIDAGAMFNVSVVENRVGEYGEGGGVLVIPGAKTFEVRNSLIASNQAQGGVSPDCRGTISSAGYNVVSNGAGCIWQMANGDLVGSEKSPIDPQIVRTDDGRMRLAASSPAVDAGDPAGCTDPEGNPLTEDQLGNPRPMDGNGDGRAACDIGATERQR